MQLAIHALETYGAHSATEYDIVNIAVGLEALFGGSSANYGKLSTLIATYLFPAGNERFENASMILDVLHLRNDFLHAKYARSENIKWFSDDQLLDAVVYGRKILSMCLKKIVENMHIPKEEELRKMLLAPV